MRNWPKPEKPHCPCIPKYDPEEIHGARGTGRTTRMLEEAIRKAVEGEVVYVMAANYQQARTLMNMVLDGLCKLPSIWFDVNGSTCQIVLKRPDKGGKIKFYSVEHPDWQWVQRRMRCSPHVLDPVLIDHFAWEQHLMGYRHG